MKTHILTFGMLHHDPVDIAREYNAYCVSAKRLRNPAWVKDLYKKTGLHHEVRHMVEHSKGFDEVMQLAVDTWQRAWENGQEEVTIAFFCSHGKHRSVACAVRFEYLVNQYWWDKTEVTVTHLDQGRWAG